MNLMNKVGICGYFGGNTKVFDGQSVKTKSLADELEIIYGNGSIKKVNTNKWKKRPFRLMSECFMIIKECENIIILPAKNGIKVFIPLFISLNRIFNKKLHYVVIGGWLPELLAKNKKIIKYLSGFNGIYVESYSMVKSIEKFGLNNVVYLPNFKRLNIIHTNDLEYSEYEPYRLCTFSRVMKEKGIEDAIEAVIAVNEKNKKIIYTLDIYGNIDTKYKERFEKLQYNFPEFIEYKGVIDFKESVSVIKDYFVLLFPTYYEGEGFAGTILDAFAAGVPVISTNWRYNSEIIRNEQNGILYDYKDKMQLREILETIKDDPIIINKMKKNCILDAKQYSPDIVIKEFSRHLD